MMDTTQTSELHSLITNQTQHAILKNISTYYTCIVVCTCTYNFDCHHHQPMQIKNIRNILFAPIKIEWNLVKR
jgi:hypothetical protein